MTTRTARHVRASLVLAMASAAAAVATWLAAASVHVVGWGADAPSRVVLLPPWSRLGVALGVVAGVALVIGVAAHKADRLPQLARAVAPLTLLLLWVVPFLPWVPDHLPLLMVLAGPMRWVTLTLACLGCALLAADEIRTGRLSLRMPGPRTVFITSFVVLVGLGVYVKGAQGVGGDEPHYLVIAHSLLVDGDLRIENNHEEGHYQSFFAGTLPPHFLRRGLDGVIYSVHSPGLPSLLLPFYAVGGEWGAMVFIGLLASLAAVAIFGLAERLTTRGVAVVTWAAVALTVPFAPQSWLIFPEMPAALIMAWTAAWLWGPPPERAWSWVWRGAVIGLLPWLHMKYSFLLAGATLCLLVRMWPRVRHAVMFLAPMALSGVVWLLSFYVMYGTPNPTVVYGYGSGAGLELSNIPRGILGLLFDQEFGLLAYSPIYVLVAFGCWVMLRRPDARWQSVGLLATTGAYVVTATQYYMWWGGWSVPARFVVPVLPLLAPMLAAGIDRCRGSAGRGVVGLLLLASISALAAVIYEPAALVIFNVRDGSGQLVEMIQGGAGLTAVLPTFIQPDWLVQVPDLLRWLVAGVLAIGVASMVGRRHVTLRRAVWSATACLVCFGAAGSLLYASRVPPDFRAELVRRGQQGLIGAYDGNQLKAFVYGEGRTLGITDLYQHASIVQPLSGVSVSMDRVSGPYALPPGRYQVRVHFESTPAATDGEVWVGYRQGPGVLARRTVETNPVVMTLDLPVALDPVWVGTSTEGTARAVSVVEVIPEHVVPRSARLAVDHISFSEGLGRDPGRYVFYLDSNVWVEPGGFWVRGGAPASLLVSPADASTVVVVIRNGGSAGPVTVEFAGRQETLSLDAWETHELRVPVTRQELLEPFTISATNGFRPAESDPESQDQRWLGCWVRLSLE